MKPQVKGSRANHIPVFFSTLLPGHLASRVRTVREGRAAGAAGGRPRAIPGGEGVACRFFRMKNTYLFIGDHKYWLMTHWEAIQPGVNYVLNRARLYRDRRDFVIQPGDTGRPEDYPASPAFRG